MAWETKTNKHTSLHNEDCLLNNHTQDICGAYKWPRSCEENVLNCVEEIIQSFVMLLQLFTIHKKVCVLDNKLKLVAFLQ